MFTQASQDLRERIRRSDIRDIHQPEAFNGDFGEDYGVLDLGWDEEGNGMDVEIDDDNGGTER